jgi:uncharacterized protein
VATGTHDRGLSARALPLAVVVALISVATSASAQAATPLPARQADRSVYDAADVIDPTDEMTLEQRHTELYEKTGVAIVIVTVPQLVDETIDQLAVRVGQSWGVGKQGADRGLVIALSRDDRKIFVATGYGTESYLPDGKVGALIDREAVPALRENQFSRGLVALDAALAAASAKEFGVTLTGVSPERPVQQSHSSTIATLISLAVLVLVALRFPWLLMFFGGFGGWGGFGRGGRGRGDGDGGGGFGGFGGGGFGGGGAGRDF